MSSNSRRVRSSTSASSPPEATRATAVLQVQIESLSTELHKKREDGGSELQSIVECLEAIRETFTSSHHAPSVQDAFRHFKGFQVLFDALRATSGRYHPSRTSKKQKEMLFKLLAAALDILSESFKDHNGNRRYFRNRVESGGWAALEQALASIGIGTSDRDNWGDWQLFGHLLAFAVDDASVRVLFTELYEAKSVNGHGSENRTLASLPGALASNGLATEPNIAAINARIRERVKGNVLVCNSEVIPTVIGFWEALPRGSGVSLSLPACAVILTLQYVATLSKYNLQALHASGMLSLLLPLAFDNDTSLSSIERDAVENLCESLMALGISSLDDARYLVRSTSTLASSFILKTLTQTQYPHIHFDLSLHGYASIELPTLGRVFPPVSTPGYTFTAWIYVDTFDPDTHTTIFGAFDSSQICFVLAYLEKDTRNFILQTSVTSSRPSVRFKSTRFEEKKWYHIAVAHRRPKSLSSSKAALYIDGEFAEQVKCNYPVPPPPSNSSTDSFASFASTNNQKLNPVQAFLGTPQDLSMRLGPGLVKTRWSLGSAHLFEDVLSDDLIAVHHKLGPRYNGNFQDCLGAFQTYEASSALAIRNELVHPGKDDSEILAAIREKASTLVPESRVLLSILPTAVMGGDEPFRKEESALMLGLSKVAGNNLYHLSRGSRTPVVVNAAVPSINEALTRSYGTAILTGDPVVINPQCLDDSMWRLGGCAAICLKLVEQATTRESIARAVEILFSSIKGNWRNSEAMERNNGYAILAALIRGKIGAGYVISTQSGIRESSLSQEDREKLSFELLSLVLGFLGYDHVKPENSVIINPLAYRVLLVDFDMWRKCVTQTQLAYYRQFIVFGVNSKYHHFNCRRLARMRIVKKFLDALKAEAFVEETFPAFMDTLRTLIRINLTGEVFRSLAMLVTYALHKPSSAMTRAARSQTGTSGRPAITTPASRRPTITTNFSSRSPNRSSLSKRDIGVKVLAMYSDILCEKGSTTAIQRFARNVTNKWLLCLLTEEDPEVVVPGAKILSRLLVVLGSNYVSKFASKTGGFVILRQRLKRWWDIPTIWPICFSILFGHDIAELDLEGPFELFSLLETYWGKKVVYPDVLPVITAMIGIGLKSILRYQEDPDSPLKDRPTSDSGTALLPETRRRSMSLTKELETRRNTQPAQERLSGQADILHTVSRFIADMQSKSAVFRDFAVNSDFVRQLLIILFPVIVSTDAVSPETELNSRDSALTFEGDDVIIRPISQLTVAPAPIVRTTTVDSQLDGNSSVTRAKPLRRASAFILVTSQQSDYSPSTARLNLVASPKKKLFPQKVSNTVVEGVLELVLNVFVDQVIARKEFPGFALYAKIPPGFQEHQAYFESYILRNALSHLSNTVQLNQKLLWEPRVLTNMARFISHVGDSVFEGWFMSGAEPLLDFAGNLMEYLQQPEVAKIKSVRLCSQAVQSIRVIFFRVVLLRLSELGDPQTTEADALAFMNKLLYWQTVLLSSETSDSEFLKLTCYQLYTKLVDSRYKIRLAAAELWRILLVQKPAETSSILNHAMSTEQKHLNIGFKRLMELDNDTFVDWVDECRPELDSLFFGAMSKAWEDFVNSENARTEESAKLRVAKRRDKLKQWHATNANTEDVLIRHDASSNHWRSNIYSSEHNKHQRATQDQQDNFALYATDFAKIDRDLHRAAAVLDDHSDVKWKLDRTEGRNRMRLRLLPDNDAKSYDYQPKRKPTDSSGTATPSGDSKATVPSISSASQIASTPQRVASPASIAEEDGSKVVVSAQVDGTYEDDFEIVEDPNDRADDADIYEDKNRKVMRSLQQGDQVQHTFNISRLVGLEACEGLLIVGKDSLYIVDNVLERSDGEIVNAWQAPPDERDPYLQMISGPVKLSAKNPQTTRRDQESRSWRWNEVISISKRRFLFRDVAIEVFFVDGRSYLLTAISPAVRDDLYSKMVYKAPHTNGPASQLHPEDAWRVESLRVAEETPKTLGSKFGHIFNSSAWNPAMRRWAKGEISNFHYLMLVNTMAGRTFNDLTQYPVFPWVLADYTSDELDLENPKTFRDLSKPMGAQNPSRRADFVERYQSFGEMGDQPPFHYGTHYSTAMIVTSYLIRLQPFVKSYLLLQGGSFDHPDRLFYSIRKTWLSASQENMSDVRELIPEFFYLPEFLTNDNGFNFGLRQGSGGAIDNVELPPWAKGDPKIFISKHREALESPYVSKHLHQWIDLVFGAKQRGEAALEHTNVFHHLSYHGAKDLDNIEDPHERLATISIIHNFGQTPHQVFSRPHPPREEPNNRIKRLDTAAEYLTRLPFPLLENQERVASLIYSPKIDRLLCAPAFKLNLPPFYDKYMEWGFADNSIRFFTTDSKKLVGLFENVHQGQLSTAIFADSRTLVTAGVDCVISTWNVVSSTSKNIDVQPKTSLFGHKEPVTVLAVSKSFSTLLSASSDGDVLLWDLNQLNQQAFVRRLASGRPVECSAINDISGDIMLCRGQKVAIYTLNGDLVLDQNVCSDHDDYIYSCAFYEGAANEWIENSLLFTGHRRGVVNVWKKRSTAAGKWILELVKRLDHIEQRLEDKTNTGAAITCITPMPQVVYTGDEDGRVYEWDCVQRER